MASLWDTFIHSLKSAADANPLNPGTAIPRAVFDLTGYNLAAGEDMPKARNLSIRERDRIFAKAMKDAAQNEEAKAASAKPQGIAGTAADLIGGIVGSSDPTLLAGAGGKTVAQRMLRQAAVQGGADVARQGINVGSGSQEHFNPYEPAETAAGGALLQGGVEGASAAARAGAKLIGHVVGNIADDFRAHAPSSEGPSYAPEAAPAETMGPDGMPRPATSRPVSPEEISRITGDTTASTAVPEDAVATPDGFLSGYDVTPAEASRINEGLHPQEEPPSNFEEVKRDPDGTIFLKYRPTPNAEPIPIKMGIDNGVAEMAINQFGDAVNKLGPAKIREAMHELMGLYPEIKSFGGFRKSGAGKGRVQEITPPTPGETNPRLAEVKRLLEDYSANNPDQLDTPEGKALIAEYVNLTDPLSRNHNVVDINKRDPLVELEGLLSDIRSGKKEIVRESDIEPEPQSTPETSDDMSPEAKLARAIDTVRPTSIENRDAIHKIRVEQAARLQRIQQRGGRLPEQLKALKGAIQQKDYESIAQHFTPEDVQALEDKINNAKGLSSFEKLHVHEVLNQMLDPAGMNVPTEHQLDLLADVFSPEVINSLLRRSKGMTNAEMAAANIGAIPRTLKATADISAPARQGINFVARKEFWRNYPKMLKMAFSPKYFDEQMESIKDSPNYDLMRYGRLAVRDSPLIQDREEQFLSKLPHKIPVVGHIVRGSDRAYTGFLRKLRADVFDTLIEKGKEAGVDWHDPKKVKALARFINTATGRGDLGEFENAAEAFSAMFFAPRFVKARLDTLGVGDVANALRGRKGYYGELYSADPFIAKEAAKSLAGFSAFYALTLALAVAGGATVEKDLRSSDALKMKIGNTRIGIGGYPPYTRLGAQIVTGKTKTQRGKLESLTSGKYGAQNRWDLITSFASNKFAPAPGVVRDFLKGTDPGGNPATVPHEAVQLLAPMVVQDTTDSLELNGPKGAWVTIPSILGADVGTYEPHPRKGRKRNALGNSFGRSHSSFKSSF